MIPYVGESSNMPRRVLEEVGPVQLVSHVQELLAPHASFQHVLLAAFTSEDMGPSPTEGAML
jgi:hypothetical protein